MAHRMRPKSKTMFDDDYKEDPELTEAYERAVTRKRRYQLTPKRSLPPTEQKPLYYRK